MTQEAPVLTPATLAARWKVSPRTVKNLILRGDLPAMQIGKQWRVQVADIEAYEQRPRAVAVQPSDTEVAS